jgi:hypothetical protein
MQATAAAVILLGDLPKEVWNLAAMPIPNNKEYGSSIANWILSEVLPIVNFGEALGLGKGTQTTTSTGETTTTAQPDTTINNMLLWFEAFAISYLIVKWGDKMLNAGLGSFRAIAGMLGIAV